MRVALTAGTARAEWCDPCALRAVVFFELFTMSNAGVDTAGHYRRCEKCGACPDASR